MRKVKLHMRRNLVRVSGHEGTNCHSDSVDECMTISLQVFTGVSRYQTIRVAGYHEKKPLQVLIYSGSTHHFLDEDLAMKLGCMEVAKQVP